MTETSITQDQLHAYVDGYLDEATRHTVERYLAQNPEAASQVRAWQAINRGLGQLAVALPERPSNLREWRHDGDELSARRASRRVSRRLQFVAVAAGIAVGLLGGWFGHAWEEYTEEPQVAQNAEPTFVRQAIVAHELFASPTQGRPVELGADQRDLLQRWLSGKHGLDVAMHVPELTAEGWHLVGGRMLSDARGPAALYVYESADKQRLSLYVAAMPDEVKKGGTWTRSDAVEICDWGKGRLHMALAGPLDRDQMKKLLGPINQQILAPSTPTAQSIGLRELPAPRLIAGLNARR